VLLCHLPLHTWLVEYAAILSYLMFYIVLLGIIIMNWFAALAKVALGIVRVRTAMLCAHLLVTLTTRHLTVLGLTFTVTVTTTW